MLRAETAKRILTAPLKATKRRAQDAKAETGKFEAGNLWLETELAISKEKCAELEKINKELSELIESKTAKLSRIANFKKRLFDAILELDKE